jgi:uncharacterized membrane protein
VSWVVVIALTAGLTAVTASQALERYQELRSGWSWDLAYYNQWFWSLTQGDSTLTVRPVAAYAQEGPSVWKMNYLAPIRFLLVPIYLVYPGPVVLLVIQNVMFWWVVPAAFTLVRSETGSRVRLFFGGCRGCGADRLAGRRSGSAGCWHAGKNTRSWLPASRFCPRAWRSL